MSQCSAEMYNPIGFGYPCSYPAKMHHEGKGYCGVHDPVKRKAKRGESSRKWRVDFDARMKHAEEEQHKLDTWDALVAACELASEQEECVCGGKGECLGCVLQAALKEAKG